jgi:hypothetical protein
MNAEAHASAFLFNDLDVVVNLVGGVLRRKR